MKDIIKRIGGVFTKPSEGIGRAMAEKKWLPALILVLVANALFYLLIDPITMRELANRMSEEQVDFVKRLKDLIIVVQMALNALVLAIGAFFVYLFYKLANLEGVFVNYFSGVCFASLIDMVAGGLFRTIIILVKKNLTVVTNLASFFPHLGHRDFLYLLLGQFDLFALWYLVALALGIAYFAKVPARKSLMIMSWFFLFKVATLTPISYIMSRIFGS